MKYFDLKTVKDSYLGFQDCMTNKSWGYLAILKSCKSVISPSTTYKVDLDITSNFLEEIFNLNQEKKKYTGGRSLYVIFSNKWDQYFNNQGKYSPNIFDVIVWAYRRKAFNDNVTIQDLLSMFSQEFNIPLGVVSKSFDTSSKSISFTDSLYSENDLKILLGQKGVDVSKNNIDAKKIGTVASPGEISRGPFVQTLYAGLDISDYVLILQSDYYSLYGNNFGIKQNSNQVQPVEVSFIKLYLTAIRTKPFILLAGISGTGKSRIVRKLAQASVTKKLQSLYDPKSVEGEYNCWKLHKPANFEIIQVKPNWHNSMDVVGYLSNIPNKHYEFTPFTEFIGRAWLHQDIPFFLCLDEMNLAPVEEYFAEFLSAIESRSKEEGKYVTDPIIQPFNNFDTKDSDGNPTEKFSDIMIAKLIGALDNDYKSNLAEMFRTKGLTLPPNLIVMGTVNMDETTYSFSRKVLDRAMSIEMNEVNYDSFITGESENDIEEFNENIKKLIVDRPISATKEDVTNKVDSTRIIDYLKCINILFENTPFKLGYRAANEAILYASAAKDFGNYSLESALDEFTLMKILSRIEGDESKLSIDEKDPKIKALNYNSEDVKYKEEGSLDTTGITILSFLHRIIVDKLGKYYQEDQDLATQEGNNSPESEIGIETLFDISDSEVETTALVSPDVSQPKKRKKLKSLLKLESMMNQLSREHFVTYWN